MAKDKLTREMVVKHLEEEMARIDTIQRAMADETIESESEHEDYREPLSADVTKEVKILLSYGGPEDGFKLQFSVGNELLGGVYYRAGWGEYEEVILGDDEAQKVFDFYMYGDTSILEGK